VTVKAVLDTSAIMAYARGALAVGELVSIVADEGEEVALPVAALVEAYSLAKIEDAPMLSLLSSNAPTIDVLPLEVEDAPEIGALARLSSFGVAQAVITATALNAFIVTADGALVRRLVADEWLIIDI
jgi:hypothetical protein